MRLRGRELTVSPEEDQVLNEVKKDVAVKATGGGLALGTLLFGMMKFSAMPFKRYQVGLFSAAGFGVGAYAGGVLALRDGINRIINIPDSTLAAETRATLEDFHMLASGSSESEEDQ